jgi:VanZ family protein
MLRQIFTPASPYKKQFKVAAIIWTIVILIGCFTPGKELPKVDVPMIDKWVHMVFFSVFAILWLFTNPTRKIGGLIRLLGIIILFGAFIEVMQGILAFLGRSMEFMDAVADTIGGIIGISIFSLLSYISEKGSKPAQVS